MSKVILLLVWMLSAAALGQNCVDIGCPDGVDGEADWGWITYGYCKHRFFIEDARRTCAKTCFQCTSSPVAAFCIDHPDMSFANSVLRRRFGTTCSQGHKQGLCGTNGLFSAACIRTCNNGRCDLAGAFAGNRDTLLEASRTCEDRCAEVLEEIITDDNPWCVHPFNFERAKKHCPMTCFGCDVSNAVAPCEDNPRMVDPNDSFRRDIGFSCEQGRQQGNCTITDDLGTRKQIMRKFFIELCPKTCGYCNPSEQLITVYNDDGILGYIP